MDRGKRAERQGLPGELNNHPNNFGSYECISNNVHVHIYIYAIRCYNIYRCINSPTSKLLK